MCDQCLRNAIDFDELLQTASDEFDEKLANVRELHRIHETMTPRDKQFARDLLDQFERDLQLSPKQWYWAQMLTQRYAKAEPLYGSFNAILVMFRLAQSHGLKRPRVRLLSDDANEPIYFELWFRPGEQDERQVEIMIGGWQGHGKRRFGGTILGDRILPFRDRLTVGIRNTIQALALDPLGTAQAMAKRLSACMYCGQRLSDDESKARGYGPICAEHYGLPWGAVSAADRKEAQRIRTSTLEELFS